MEGFQFEKLQDYLIDLENYMNENVKSAEVRKVIFKLQLKN
jgi:hypothetical protein